MRAHTIHGCEKQRPGNSRFMVLRDMHAPKKFRMNGVLSQNPDFAAAFACPPSGGACVCVYACVRMCVRFRSCVRMCVFVCSPTRDLGLCHAGL